MTLDTIDRAFVSRWEARRAKATAQEAPPLHESSMVAFEEESTAAPAEDVPASALPDPAPAPVAPVEVSLIDRLLAVGQEQWECLADEVEVARREGHRVIAVVGAEPGEGRSTLIDCLARTLRDRGRDVVVLASADDATLLDGTRDHGGHGHDRRIVLIDAGVWFPPGPIRRHQLVRESVGCDAAILVRRADREPVAARATALAALGMSVLGEVVTFASPDGDA